MTKKEIIESVVDAAIARNRGAGQNFYVDYECDGRYGKGECLSEYEGIWVGSLMIDAGAKPLWTELGRVPRRGQKGLYVRREHYCFDWNDAAKDKLVEALTAQYYADPDDFEDDEDAANDLRESLENLLRIEENYVGSDFDRKFEPFNCFDDGWYGQFVYAYPCLCYELGHVRDVCKREGKIVEIQIEGHVGEDWNRNTVEITPDFGDNEIEALCKRYESLEKGVELSCVKVEDAE